MGLDGVEIVMKVEETFDITIADKEAEKCLTPGQLIDLVMNKVGRTDHAACLTQRAFHRLRASLMERLGLKRNQIRPETRLAELFPRPVRKQQLTQILGDIGVNKDIELVRPEWLGNFIMAGMFGGGATVAIYLAWHPISSHYFALNLLIMSPVVAGIVFVVLFGWLGFRMTRGFCNEFRPSLATVAELSRWIVANGSQVVEAPPGQWSREQVAEIVREIIIDQLGCEKDYREDANFVKDLGLD